MPDAGLRTAGGKAAVMGCFSIKRQFNELSRRLIRGREFWTLVSYAAMQLFYEASFFSNAIRLSIIRRGEGGHPEMQQSTGITLATPFATA
jgi:hypothetical protein